MELKVIARNQSSEPVALAYEYDGPLTFGNARIEVNSDLTLGSLRYADDKLAAIGIAEVTYSGKTSTHPQHGEAAHCKCAKTGKDVAVTLASRPDLAEAIAADKSIRSSAYAAQTAFWTSERLKSEAGPRAEMARQLAELVAQIPSGHERIYWIKTGQFDGYESGYLQLESGMKIESHGPRGTARVRTGVEDGPLTFFGPEVKPVDYGWALAIHPGALGACASEWVGSISHEDAAALTAAAIECASEIERRKSSAAETELRREQDLLTIDVPAAAVEAYKAYNGSAEKAWEAEDEAGWALIGQWSSAIEAQGLAHAATASRVSQMIRDASREEPVDY
jgi:hypothetical protein